MYEDYDRMVTKNKAELYELVDEGDVDWFSDYDEDEAAKPSLSAEERKQYNDYRFTECYSSIRPPDLVGGGLSVKIEAQVHTPNLLPEAQPSDETKNLEYEMRKLKIFIKQNYVVQPQRVEKYINGAIFSFKLKYAFGNDSAN